LREIVSNKYEDQKDFQPFNQNLSEEQDEISSHTNLK